MSQSFLPASMVLLAIAVTLSLSTTPPPTVVSNSDRGSDAEKPALEVIYAGEHVVMLDGETARGMYGDFYENCFWKYHEDDERAAVESMCARLSYDAVVMAKEEGARRMVPRFRESNDSIFWSNKPACVFDVHCTRAVPGEGEEYAFED